MMEVLVAGFTMLLLLRALTTAALGLWLAAITQYLRLPTLSWQCALIAVFLPLAICLALVTFLMMNSPVLTYHRIACIIICLFLLWAILILLFLAPAIRQLPHSKSPPSTSPPLLDSHASQFLLPRQSPNR